MFQGESGEGLDCLTCVTWPTNDLAWPRPLQPRDWNKMSVCVLNSNTLVHGEDTPICVIYISQWLQNHKTNRCHGETMRVCVYVCVCETGPTAQPVGSAFVSACTHTKRQRFARGVCVCKHLNKQLVMNINVQYFVYFITSWLWSAVERR